MGCIKINAYKIFDALKDSECGYNKVAHHVIRIILERLGIEPAEEAFLLHKIAIIFDTYLTDGTTYVVGINIDGKPYYLRNELERSMSDTDKTLN